MVAEDGPTYQVTLQLSEKAKRALDRAQAAYTHDVPMQQVLEDIIGLFDHVRAEIAKGNKLCLSDPEVRNFREIMVRQKLEAPPRTKP